MALQTLVVALLVAGCTVYAVWTLMPAALRRRAASAMLRWPLPAAATAPLPRPPPPPVRSHPRRRPPRCLAPCMRVGARSGAGPAGAAKCAAVPALEQQLGPRQRGRAGQAALDAEHHAGGGQRTRRARIGRPHGRACEFARRAPAARIGDVERA